MSSIALPPPNAPNTSTVRLPSISELTSRSPISDNSSMSPKDRLPTLRPLKGYVLGQVVSPQGSEYSGGSSPSLQYYSQPAAGQAPPIPQAPVVGVAHTHINPAVHGHPHISPAGHGQAPQGQHITHGAHPLINGPYQYVRQIPNGSPSYPIYYQQPGYTAYAIPEVINKPVNKCHRCGTTETPEWRRGPNGVRTLCNACGLFHAKLVKRKGAALAAEEVLNNKVCKGKNGRRISIKKHMFNESLLKSGGGFGMPVPPMMMGGGYPYQMIRQ